MAAKAAPVNPFASAKKATPVASKPKANVIVAGDVLDPNGQVLFERAAVVDAINNYCEGDTMVKQGEAMMTTNRPTVLAFGKQAYTQNWVELQRLPDNPKISTDATGTGRIIGCGFNDRQVNLNDAEFAEMVALMGADAAEANVTRRNEFKLNPEVLDQEVACKDLKTGKPVTKPVMEHIAEALQAKFADNPEILGNLFSLTEVFKTNKGLIHKGLQLATQNPKSPAAAIQLQEFLRVTKTVIQLKPGKV